MGIGNIFAEKGGMMMKLFRYRGRWKRNFQGCMCNSRPSCSCTVTPSTAESCRVYQPTDDCSDVACRCNRDVRPIKLGSFVGKHLQYLAAEAVDSTHCAACLTVNTAAYWTFTLDQPPIKSVS